MTNAERIKSMTIDELANYLESVEKDIQPYCHDRLCRNWEDARPACNACIRTWLSDTVPESNK